MSKTIRPSAQRVRVIGLRGQEYYLPEAEAHALRKAGHANYVGPNTLAVTREITSLRGPSCSVSGGIRGGVVQQLEVMDDETGELHTVTAARLAYLEKLALERPKELAALQAIHHRILTGALANNAGEKTNRQNRTKTDKRCVAASRTANR